MFSLPDPVMIAVSSVYNWVFSFLGMSLMKKLKRGGDNKPHCGRPSVGTIAVIEFRTFSKVH